jgi:hypothetical protein
MLRSMRALRGALPSVLAALLFGTGGIAAQVSPPPTDQNTKIPNTLRYGTGHIDVPSASVLPHLVPTATFSTFRAGIGMDGVRRREWMTDGSLAVGLFGRAEAGLTFQDLGGGDAGSMLGAFAQYALLRPGERGLGFALGGRYVSPPGLDDAQPGRLGFPDGRFRREPASGVPRVRTVFTPYGVASVFLPGGDLPLLPTYDLTLSLGYGGGMFAGGRDLDFYAGSSSGGWFGGATAHLDFGENLLLNLIGDYNGFDLNVGAQVDFGGIRAGAYVLGANYGERVSVYRSRKLALSVSVAACPDAGGQGGTFERFRCWPEMIRERTDADTVRLPAPPPDTVIVVREVAPPPPPGRDESLCLSTGQSIPIRVTVDADTLVGPDHVSLRTLRSTLVLAGSYAESMEWYVDGMTIPFEGARFQPEGGMVRLECREIMRIGEHQGVPLFATVDDFTPFVVIYLPVRPGVWQTYVRVTTR